MARQISRRAFIRQATLGSVAGPILLSGLARAADAKPNERLTLGVIGIGTMGRGHLSRFAGYPDVQVLAVCDVVRERLEQGRETVNQKYSAERSKGTYKGCDAYHDFRELLARDDIDAVVIATPDHWHAIPAIAAARAGKDIYCEKPLARTIAESRAIAKAAAEKNVVFQTGSQQRTEFGGKFRHAAELVRNGHIGQVKTVRIGVGGPPQPCDLPEQETPEGTDWELWLGPAPLRGYNEVLCPKGIHKHFPAWRNYREYAGGGVADMGAHHFDIAQWALNMDASGPVKIDPPEGSATTGLKLTYANGIEMFHGGPSGCTFEGTAGMLYVDRGKIESTPADIASRTIGENDPQVYRADNHHRNWLDCVRSRKATICPAEIGHRSATVCHLTNIGYQLRRKLTWDPVAERFDDEEANRLAVGEMRSPWTL